jgi:hypothetical protein
MVGDVVAVQHRVDLLAQELKVLMVVLVQEQQVPTGAVVEVGNLLPVVLVQAREVELVAMAYLLIHLLDQQPDLVKM